MEPNGVRRFAGRGASNEINAIPTFPRFVHALSGKRNFNLSERPGASRPTAVGRNLRVLSAPTCPIEIAWPISSDMSPRSCWYVSLSDTCPTFSVRRFRASFARIRRSPAWSRKRIRRRCESKAAAGRLLFEAW